MEGDNDGPTVQTFGLSIFLYLIKGDRSASVQVSRTPRAAFE